MNPALLNSVPEHVRPELFAILDQPEMLLAQVEQELYRRNLEGSLKTFVREAWPSIEPATPFVDGWHLDAISEHLEACTRREIRNLVINMPPRHMKSIMVSVAWPTWVWTHSPHTKWVFSSYSGSLSIRDSLKCRRLIQSLWYKRFWGNSFTFVSDQNQKSRFENDKTGHRLATSVGGLMTGEGGDFIVVDDPHNALQAESPTQRETVIDWWDQTMSTRFNDPKTGVRVIVMQRLHQNDLTGHVLKEKGWEQLILPAEYERTKRVSVTGWKDPRTTEGELLWPERFGRKELDELKTKLGSYGTAGQLQQRPAPREGGLIKLPWFDNRYSVLPDLAQVTRVVQSWDTAKKPEEMHDYSVCTTWYETATHYYLVDVLRMKLEFPDLIRAVEGQADKWNPHAVLIEDAASGTSLIQHFQRGGMLPVIPISTRGQSKEVRCAAVTPMMEAGRVRLPERAAWLTDFEQEIVLFPAVENDDQTDSTTQFLNWAREPAEIFVG